MLRLRGFACVAAVCLCAGVRTAAAQDDEEQNVPAKIHCKEPPAKEDERKRQAGALFDRADKAFREKNYPKALMRFLCSFYMVEHEVTATNIERVVEKVENKRLAESILGDYVKLKPDGDMTPRIEELRTKIQEQIDAENASKEPTCPPVTCPPPPKPKPCPAPVDLKPYVLAHGQSLKLMNVFGWTSVGMGAASIIAGVALQVLAVTMDPKDATHDKLQAGAIAAFSAGGIAAGIGTAELVIASKRKKVLSTLHAGSGVELVIRF